MIIGLTGKNAAGKGEAANHLVSRGFVYFSLSDELRAKATEKGLDHTRENLILLGRGLREELGTGALAAIVNGKIERLKKDGQSRFVVDSIRSVGEVKELEKNKDFMLLGIEAEEALRFGRMQKRGRPGDPATMRDFKAMEAKELDGKGGGQQLTKCLEKAKMMVDNNSSLQELRQKLDKLIEGQE